MDILILGKEETKTYIKNNVDISQAKFLIPAEINAAILEKIVAAKNEFDVVILNLEELKDIPEIKKHLINLIGRYASKSQFFILDEKDRLAKSREQLEARSAILVKSYQDIGALPLMAKESSDELDLNLMLSDSDEEREVSMSAIDQILDDTPVPVTPTPSQNVADDDDILAILGDTPSSENTQANIRVEDILGGVSEPVNNVDEVDPLADILGGNTSQDTEEDPLDAILGTEAVMPTIPTSEPVMIDSPPTAQVMPGGNTNYTVSEDNIPELERETKSGGLRGIIDNLVGPGKMGQNQLPAIPQEVIPNNLKRPYIFTFWASKGGTGKTTVALNTCAYISSLTDLRVILVDVDEFGDTGLSMDMERKSNGPVPTVDDFINNISSMKSFEDVTPFVLKETSTRLHLLLTSENSSTSQRPTRADYQNVLRILQQYFDIIAFDCGDKLYDEYTRLALGKADFIVCVVDQGFPTLSHMSRIISEFAQPDSGVGKDKLVMVVNKYQKNVGMSITEISKWFDAGVSSIHAIPALFYESMRLLNQGDLLILSHNVDIKKSYNQIVCNLLNKIKINQQLNT